MKSDEVIHPQIKTPLEKEILPQQEKKNEVLKIGHKKDSLEIKDTEDKSKGLPSIFGVEGTGVKGTGISASKGIEGTGIKGTGISASKGIEGTGIKGTGIPNSERIEGTGLKKVAFSTPVGIKESVKENLEYSADIDIQDGELVKLIPKKLSLLNSTNDSQKVIESSASNNVIEPESIDINITPKSQKAYSKEELYEVRNR
ncbi:MAG: hypothetical protein ACTSPQ_06155 [Candidatus Helarchaeota archaeon]